MRSSVSRLTFWITVVVISLGFFHSWMSRAHSAPLTNTELSLDQFLSIAELSSPVTLPSVLPFFDFEVAGVNVGFPDGQVYSQVFPGIGEANGFNIYVYQVLLLSGSDVDLAGFSLPFPADLSATPVRISGVGDVTSFWVNEVDPPIGFTGASVAPSGANWAGGTLAFDLDMPQGTVSFLVGVFAPANMSPELVVTSLKATNPSAEPIITPLSYSPTPEPSLGILFGIGLMCFLVFWRGLEWKCGDRVSGHNGAKRKQGSERK